MGVPSSRRGLESPGEERPAFGMGSGSVTALARSADLCWAVVMDDRRELGEGPPEIDDRGSDYELPAAPDRMSERLRPEEVLGELAWLERLSRRLIADPHLADDLFQSTLAVALERPPARGQLRGWLRMVLKNLWNDELRRRLRDSDGLARHGQDQGELALPSADELAERAALQLELGREVMSLEPELRDLVLWHFYGELSAAEIARRTDYSESQVRRRLKRALDMLRVRLDEHQLEQGAERRFARSSWMALFAVGVSASELAPAARASTATATKGIATKGTATTSSVSSTASALVAWTAAASLLLGGLLWVAHQPRVPPAAHFVPLESTASVEAVGVTEGLIRAAASPAPRVALEAAFAASRERIEVQVLSAANAAPLDEARVHFVDAAGVSHPLWRFDGESEANFGLGAHPDPRRSVRHEPAPGLGWFVAQATGHRLTRAARRWPPTPQVDRARLELVPERRIPVKVIDAASGGAVVSKQSDRHARTVLNVRTSSRALSGGRLSNLPDDPADACAVWQQERLSKEGLPDPFGVLVPFGDAPFWAHLCLGEYPLASLRINAATRELVFRVDQSDLDSFRQVRARLVDVSGAPVEGSLFLTATGRSAFMKRTGEFGPGELVQHAPPGVYSCLAEYQPSGDAPRGERLRKSFRLDLRADDPGAWNLGDIVLEAPQPTVPVELVFHDVAPDELYVENWTAEREGTSRFMYAEWHMEGTPDQWRMSLPRSAARLHTGGPDRKVKLDNLSFRRRHWPEVALEPYVLDPAAPPERVVLHVHRARPVTAVARSLPWRYASYRLLDSEGWVLDSGRLSAGWMDFKLAPGRYRLELGDPTAPSGQAAQPLVREFTVGDGPQLVTL